MSKQEKGFFQVILRNVIPVTLIWQLEKTELKNRLFSRFSSQKSKKSVTNLAKSCLLAVPERFSALFVNKKRMLRPTLALRLHTSYTHHKSSSAWFLARHSSFLWSEALFCLSECLFWQNSPKCQKLHDKVNKLSCAAQICTVSVFQCVRTPRTNRMQK